MFTRVRQHPLPSLLAVALILRVVTAVAVTEHLEAAGKSFLIGGDADGYWMLGGTIASGEKYSVYDPPRRVLRMPGLPVFLAVVQTVAGDSFLAARLALAAVGTAACGAVYLLGAALDSKRTGLIAATLATFWPVLIGFSVLVLSETLFALMLVLSLVAVARLVKATGSRRYVWAALSGLGITLATHVRPTWLPAAIAVPLAYWWWNGRTGTAASVGLVVIVATAICMAPWTFRNRAVTGHWIPTTLWVGPSLYDGLNPQATGASDMRFFDEDRLLDRMSEYEMDREYRRRAWQFVVDNPGRSVELVFVKLWRYWSPWPLGEQFASPLARFAVSAYYLPVLMLACLAAWVRRRDVWLVGLCAAPLLFFSVVHAVFIGSLRYRLPAEYPLCVLAAIGAQIVVTHVLPARAVSASS